MIDAVDEKFTIEPDRCSSMPLELFWWGSDFPHSVGTFPRSREYIEETFGPLDEKLRHTLLVGNAAEHLHLDLDADITETPVAA